MSDIIFEHHIEIPHLKLDGGGIDGDYCVILPDDPVAWKKAFEKVLDGNNAAFLTITNNVAGDFALTFGHYPNDEALRSMDGSDGSAHFGANISREVLQKIYDSIGFALNKAEPEIQE